MTVTRSQHPRLPDRKGVRLPDAVRKRLLNQIVNSSVKVTHALALNTSNPKQTTIGKHLLRDVGHKIPNGILCSVLRSGVLCFLGFV